MPIILRLAGRYIQRRLLQSVLFVLGVALGVAVVIAIDLANGSASRAFALSTESVTGRATHQIIGGPSGLPTDLYTHLRVDLGLQAVAPVIEDYVRALDLGDTPLHLLGVDPFAEPPFRSYLTNVSVAGTAVERFRGAQRLHRRAGYRPDQRGDGGALRHHSPATRSRCSRRADGSRSRSSACCKPATTPARRRSTT